MTPSGSSPSLCRWPLRSHISALEKMINCKGRHVQLGLLRLIKILWSKIHMRKGEVFPVLMCGGSDTRLWPLRRQNHPKQSIPLLGNESLFDLTPKRSLHTPGANHGICVANKAYRFPVSAALGCAGSAHWVAAPISAGTISSGCKTKTAAWKEQSRSLSPA